MPSAGAVIGCHPAQVGGRVLPAVRAREVHQLPSGQSRHDALLDLFIELFPAFVGDGGVGAQQVVHCIDPLQAADPEGPAVSARGASGPAPASTSASISVIGSDREQVGSQVLVEHGIVAAQPLEDHGGVLFFLVPVVGQDGRQARGRWWRRPAGRTSRPPPVLPGPRRAPGAGRSSPVRVGFRVRAVLRSGP